MEKQEIRQFITHQLDALDHRQQREQQIYDRLFTVPAWENAGSIAVTLSFRNECPTDPVIEKALNLSLMQNDFRPLREEIAFYERVHSSSINGIEQWKQISDKATYYRKMFE